MLQRASSVENVYRYQNGTINVHVAQQLPFGYTGFDTGRASVPSILTPNFTAVISDYNNGNDMVIIHDDCGASCTTSVKVDSHKHFTSSQVTNRSMYLGLWIWC
jgi:hypothetical protein